MCVYIVLRSYWMSSPDVFKVFDNEVQAKDCVEELNKQDNVHAYYICRPIEL